MSGRFAKGCTLEDGSHKRTSFAVAKKLGMASVPLPASVDLTQFAPPVCNQTRYSGCEGASSSSAIYTTLAAAGERLSWVPSQSGIYRLARAIDRGDPAIPLADEGTQTNAVERALNQFGVQPMIGNYDGTNTDFSDATINAEPTLSELEQDAIMLMIGTYQITSSGAEKVDDVKRALASGFAVRVDTGVDNAFEDWTPSQAPYGRPDPNGILGGHALFCLGYSASNVFTIRNSWSEAYGLSGNILVNTAFIEQADCYAWNVQGFS